ncbi:MAG TPA: hypothetical protein DDX98_14155 [Bacteroidales bacterium]|jgi:signal transduction histidine kinase|nr:hypothetical protein [Bacteroidales bacterium]
MKIQPYNKALQNAMIVLFLLFIGAGNYRCFSQSEHDSGLHLSSSLQNSVNTDSLQSIALKYKLEGKIYLALELFEFILNRAQEEGNTYIVARVKIDIGTIYYNWGQYDKSLKYFLEALSISADGSMDDMESEALNYIGKYYHSVGDFEKSYKYYEKSLKIASRISDTIRIAFVTNNIGKHFADYGEITKSLDYCLRAYNLQKDKILDKEVFATSCNHLGNIYGKLYDYQKAIDFHNEALMHRSSINYIEGIGKSYLNLSKVYFKFNHIDSSEVYATKALALFRQVEYTKGIIKCNSQLGRIKQYYGSTGEAEAYFNTAHRLSQEINYDKGILTALLSLADLSFYKREYNQAIDYYNQCLLMAREQNKKEAIRDSYSGMQKTYERLKRFEEANRAGKSYISVSEDLIKEEHNKHIANLKVAYETERKEKMNRLLLSENQLKTLKIKEKNLVILLFILSFVLMSLLAAVGIARYIKKRNANKQLTQLNEELVKVNKEKDKFFSIIAHELRNPLWWFKNITETLSKNFSTMSQEEVLDSLKTMDDSAKTTFHLMDNLLHWTRSRLGIISYKPIKINLKEVIQQNIHLFQLMIEYKNIYLQTELEENQYVFADANMIHTILRNLLSNAIKFTPAHGTISILTQTIAEQAIVIIEDTGVGIENRMAEALFDDKKTFSTLGTMQEKGSGLGLKLCKEFLTINKGGIKVYGKKDEGTRVRFYLPLCTVADKKLQESRVDEEELV